MQKSFHLSECPHVGSHIPSWSLFLFVFPEYCNLLALLLLVSQFHDWLPLLSWIFSISFLNFTIPQGCSHHPSLENFLKFDFQCWTWVIVPPACCPSSHEVLSAIQIQCVKMWARSFSGIAWVFPTCQVLCCEWDADFKKSNRRERYGTSLLCSSAWPVVERCV